MYGGKTCTIECRYGGETCDVGCMVVKYAVWRVGMVVRHVVLGMWW